MRHKIGSSTCQTLAAAGASSRCGAQVPFAARCPTPCVVPPRHLQRRFSVALPRESCDWGRQALANCPPRHPTWVGETAVREPRARPGHNWSAASGRAQTGTTGTGQPRRRRKTRAAAEWGRGLDMGVSVAAVGGERFSQRTLTRAPSITPQEVVGGGGGDRPVVGAVCHWRGWSRPWLHTPTSAAPSSWLSGGVRTATVGRRDERRLMSALSSYRSEHYSSGSRLKRQQAVPAQF